MPRKQKTNAEQALEQDKPLEYSAPECEKLVAVAPVSNKIAEFLEWVREKHGASLAVAHEHTEICAGMGGFKACGYMKGELANFHFNMESLLAEFFEIDLDKVEAERRMILNLLQERDQ